MLVDFATELITYLEAQVGEGLNLEGVTLIQFSDAPVPHQHSKAVVVDWDNDLTIEFRRSGSIVTGRFAIGALASHTLGEKEADQRVQDMLMRWDSETGKWRGLIPALSTLEGLVSETTGHHYATKLDGKPVRGSLGDPSKRIYRAGCYLPLEVSLHCEIRDFSNT